MEKHLKGSFTVEAAGVMAVILFGIGTIITEAGRIHDQVSCAMTVHEAAEKARHEKTVDLEEIEAFFQKNKGLRLHMKDDRLSLREEMDSCGRAGRKLGKGDPAPTLSPGNISAEDYIDRETGGRG